MRRRPLFLSALSALALVAAACGGSDGVAFDGPTGAVSVLPESDVEFVEISPFARFGPAIGDFTSGGHATFGIFGAEQSSPPHTHSDAYYGVVLRGEMNNPFGTETDPPTLGPASFWSVPGDAEHVTACLDPDGECRFFFHSASAFDFFPLDELTAARGADAAAIPAADLDFAALAPYGAATTVWGDREAGPHGTILRIDGGADTGELAQRNPFTLVPVTGSLRLTFDGETVDAPVGSLVEAEANAPHALACGEGADCVVYLFSDAGMEINR